MSVWLLSVRKVGKLLPIQLNGMGLPKVWCCEGDALKASLVHMSGPDPLDGVHLPLW
jgi:hypothetical protein